MDYIGLNNLIIKNRYLFYLIGEFLDWLGRTRCFIHLNLTDIYYQMRICKKDKWKIIFKTRYGYFEYQIMLFGFFNLLAIIQSYISKFLAKKLDIFVIVYLDNIQTYTNKANHIDSVWLVLK